jgi:proline dehydrogenase
VPSSWQPRRRSVTGVIGPSDLLRRPLLVASRRGSIRRVVENAPISRGVVHRFVAGDTVEQALETASGLAADGLDISLDRLGEDTLDATQATATSDAYVDLLARVAEAGLAERTEVSLKLSAVGQALDDAMTLDNAQRICAAAASAGTTVTIDMEDHSTTDKTLETVRKLRADFPAVGAVVQAYLHRTEGDCRDLAGSGSRVRLCKGAYAEPPSVAYQRKSDVDASYRRCLDVLMNGDGYPMVATHDPALIDDALQLVEAVGRNGDSYELQMLHGVRPDEQRRLAHAGHRMRVYVPYGTEWYGYLMRRLAERPANVAFFLRALSGRD